MQQHTNGGYVAVTGHNGEHWPKIPDTDPFPEAELERNRDFIQRCRAHTMPFRKNRKENQ
ncbi:hypothetical protein [Bifidobacterium catenulatum]|uniref:hypothetical protein n=1 Tax=Bifidobacterium TaxID=1678 RepID=UPI0012AC2DA5|nr:hypothetical protein [Bifidobacterium catenulatum]